MLLRQRLHEARSLSDEFLGRVLKPLGSCVTDHLKAFISTELLQDRIMDGVVFYGSWLTEHQREPSVNEGDASKLFEALRTSANRLADDLKSFSESKCREDAKDMPHKATGAINIVLPYARLGLAHLQGAMGWHDAAAATVAHWIEAQFREDAQFGETGRPLPIWYRIRGQFDLVFFLAHGNLLRTKIREFSKSIESLEELFSTRDTIENLEHWSKVCDTRKSSELKAEGRLMYTYLSLVNNLAWYSADLDPDPPDDDVISGTLLLDRVRADTEASIDCLLSAQALQTRYADQLRGSLFTAYGTTLARFASDEKLADKEHRGTYRRDAKIALSKAMPYLRLAAEADEKENTKAFPEDQIFFRSESREAIYRAQRILDQFAGEE